MRAAWAKFSQGKAAPRLDVLVCNAGVLLNELTLTSERVEVTFACHLLFGTYLLGKLALPALEATAGGRLVVVSSGGMYNSKFPSWETAASLEGEFSGNLAYAFAKRGQVLLCYAQPPHVASAPVLFRLRALSADLSDHCEQL